MKTKVLESSRYIKSTITTYNDDEMLWETKVGTTEQGMPLLFIALGKSEQESRNRADWLIGKLLVF